MNELSDVCLTRTFGHGSRYERTSFQSTWNKFTFLANKQYLLNLSNARTLPTLFSGLHTGFQGVQRERITSTAVKCSAFTSHCKCLMVP